MTTKGGKTRGLLVFAAVAWTAGSAVAASLVYLRAPLIFEVGGAPLFLSSPGVLIPIWALGLTALFSALSKRKVLRLGFGLLFVAGLLAVFAGGVHRLSRPVPEDAASGGDGVSAEGRTTLLVAVDGMSWTAILPLVRQGELPNIARLMEEGSYGVLHSQRTYRTSVDKWGYWSPVVWTSIATGVQPRRHGITDFVLGEGPARGGIAASTHRLAPAFWNLFSAFDKRVAVVGWWATWPAEAVSGFMVSSHVGLRGWRTDERGLAGLTYPGELADELDLRGGTPDEIKEWVNREIFPFEVYPALIENKLETTYAALWQDRLYLDVTRSLIERREPIDLYAVYFEGIDVVSHYLWGTYRDRDRPTPLALPEGFREHSTVVPAYYRVIDRYLGELLAMLPEETTVLIVSDHGFETDPANPDGADHSPYGVLIARGEGIARGRSINLDPVGSAGEALDGTTDVLDVLPTLLYLHGLPIARTLEGEILGSALTSELLDTHPALWVDSYGDFEVGGTVEIVVDPEISKEYEERLRALGYL